MNMEATYKCCSCNLIKPVSLFYPDKSKRGHRYQCKDCSKINRFKYREYHKKYVADHMIKNKEVYQRLGRKKNLRRAFMTEEIYERLLVEQDNKCAICKQSETIVDKRTGKVRRLAADHCYVQLKHRGLLCQACNTAIGKLKDNINILLEAIKYLEKYGTK